MGFPSSRPHLLALQQPVSILRTSSPPLPLPLPLATSHDNPCARPLIMEPPKQHLRTMMRVFTRAGYALDQWNRRGVHEAPDQFSQAFQIHR